MKSWCVVDKSPPSESSRSMSKEVDFLFLFWKTGAEEFHASSGVTEKGCITWAYITNAVLRSISIRLLQFSSVEFMICVTLPSGTDLSFLYQPVYWQTKSCFQCDTQNLKCVEGPSGSVWLHPWLRRTPSEIDVKHVTCSCGFHWIYRCYQPRLFGLYGPASSWRVRTEPPRRGPHYPELKGDTFPVQTEQTRLIRYLLYGSIVFKPRKNKNKNQLIQQHP